MDIKTLKHIHFTGIKGVGMTALALCAQDLGIKITGSDVAEEFITDEVLARRGLAWNAGFGPQNLEPKPDLVVTTGAHGGFNNPEVLAAKELGIPVMSHAEALAKFTEGKKVIAVCGVGGKTTTCAMIATILEHAGLNPSYAIGVSDIPSLSAPGKYSEKGEYFVVEADEYAISPGIDNRPRFSLLNPDYLLISNIKHDHPDIYPTFDDVKKVFADLILKVTSNSGVVISNYDNYVELPLPPDFQGPIWDGYGKEHGNWKITAFDNNEGETRFNLLKDDPNNGITDLYKLTICVPGLFNAYNATAAFILSHRLGIEPQIIIEGLIKYKGCKRRFEKIAEKNGIIYYDDYAHHPTEIYQTLLAALSWYNSRRIVAVFQPHTYSRTKALLTEFSKSFIYANIVGITDIFASAREPEDKTINSQMLVSKIKENIGIAEPENAIYIGNLDNATEWAINTLKKGDIFITLGAGNVYKIHRKILEKI